jgi:hypothetical protein
MLYRSEPNTLCCKAYASLILQGFKPLFVFARSSLLIARSSPVHRSPGEELGEIFAVLHMSAATVGSF